MGPGNGMSGKVWGKEKSTGKKPLCICTFSLEAAIPYTQTFDLATIYHTPNVFLRELSGVQGYVNFLLPFRPRLSYLFRIYKREQYYDLLSIHHWIVKKKKKILMSLFTSYTWSVPLNYCSSLGSVYFKFLQNVIGWT